MPIRSLGNSSVRYNAVMSKTGDVDSGAPIERIDYSWGGGRGINGGGWDESGDENAIEYITIETTGNAQDFGNLGEGRGYCGHVASNADRGVIGNGWPSQNNMEYVNIASLGNANDFGDQTHSHHGNSGVTSGIRGVFAGGGPTSVDTISYITIANTGNAQDYGELSVARNYMAGVTNGIRGCYMGGYSNPPGSNQSVIDYVTIATTGNAIDFGDIDTTSRGRGGTDSSAQRGMAFGGFSNAVDTIQYISIPTLGDTTDFGELTTARGLTASCSNGIRGCTVGGCDSPSTEWVNTIDYVTMETTGNATDFGDNIEDMQRFQACSGN